MHEFLSCRQIDDCRPPQVHFLCLNISSLWITFLVNFYDSCGNTAIVNIGIPAYSSWHKPEYLLVFDFGTIGDYFLLIIPS